MRQILAVAVVCVLAGCDTPPIVTHEQVRTVIIDGETVYVSPMKHPDSWGATRYRLGPFLGANPAVEAALLTRAIEQATGCKVVSSQYQAELGANLYALVDCTKKPA